MNCLWFVLFGVAPLSYATGQRYTRPLYRFDWTEAPRDIYRPENGRRDFSVVNSRSLSQNERRGRGNENDGYYPEDPEIVEDYEVYSGKRRGNIEGVKESSKDRNQSDHPISKGFAESIKFDVEESTQNQEQPINEQQNIADHQSLLDQQETEKLLSHVQPFHHRQ